VLKGKELSPPEGRFSLGRMGTGSGYCIGMVVEYRMGQQNSRGDFQDHDDELSNTWVIGEQFFRDVQVAFEVSNSSLQP
jgi:hypothetical protein